MTAQSLEVAKQLGTGVAYTVSESGAVVRCSGFEGASISRPNSESDDTELEFGCSQPKPAPQVVESSGGEYVIDLPLQSITFGAPMTLARSMKAADSEFEGELFESPHTLEIRSDLPYLELKNCQSLDEVYTDCCKLAALTGHLSMTVAVNGLTFSSSLCGSKKEFLSPLVEILKEYSAPRTDNRLRCDALETMKEKFSLSQEELEQSVLLMGQMYPEGRFSVAFANLRVEFYQKPQTPADVSATLELSWL
jgi:hypothetical protein